jgi:hypothetical protein
MFNEAAMAEMTKYAARARAQIRDREARSAREISPGVAAVEASAAAFAFGCADGRSGGDGTAALWTGAALHAFSFFSGGESRLGDHARALGTGALAAGAYRTGLAAGQRAAVADAFGARIDPPPRAPVGATRPVTSVTMELTVARLTITARR